MKYRIPLINIKNGYKSVGILFFLLLAASFVFRGTGDYSVLLISYGALITAVASSIHFFRKTEFIRFSLLTLLLFFWLGWIALLPALGLVSNTAFFGIFQCSGWIFCFILFTSHQSKWLWNYFIKLLWVFGIFCGGYALTQLFLRNAMPTGFFASKNTAAAFFMVVDLLLIGEYLQLLCPELNKITLSKSSKRVQKAILWVSIYIITLALLAALSRGVLLCFTAFCALEIFLCRNKIKFKNIYPLLAALLFSFATLLLFAQPAIAHRLELLAHEKSRLILWQGAWHLWQNTPWYGLGIFNFKHYYPAFSMPGDGSNLEYAHNDFLQLFIETGVPGSAVLMGVLVTIIAYAIRYVKHPSQNPVLHIQCITCFSALAALATHSFIDFNFYVLPMNLLIGCFLGYFHYCCMQEGSIRIYSLSGKNFWVLRYATSVFLLFISFYFIRFILFENSVRQTQAAIQAKQFKNAIIKSEQALHSYSFVEILSLKIDAYLQLIQQTQSPEDRHILINKTENSLKRAMEMNPYFARTYFQMALLQSVVLNHEGKAKLYFIKSLKNNPHFCLARLTFARFLIEQKDLHSAQEILEAGLLYPIPPEYIEIYLNYLAKLRFENGNVQGAEKAANRLAHLRMYQQDYSDLA